MSLVSRKSLVARLRRSRRNREDFVASHLSKTIAYQIRGLRDTHGETQREVADAIEASPNSMYRLESAAYGKATLTSLRRIAAHFDVALIVRFVPFGELLDWVTGTPRTEHGLRSDSFKIATFEDEFMDLDTISHASKKQASVTIDTTTKSNVMAFRISREGMADVG